MTSEQINSATGAGGGPPGGTTGLPESDSGGTKGGNQIQSHSLLTPVGSADSYKMIHIYIHICCFFNIVNDGEIMF